MTARFRLSDGAIYAKTNEKKITLKKKKKKKKLLRSITTFTNNI